MRLMLGVFVFLVLISIALSEYYPAEYEAVVTDIINALGTPTPTFGPVIVRLAWHASGTYDKELDKYGSQGATMRFEPESGYANNNGLDVARTLLDPIKEKYEDVTYSDLWTLAACVAIRQMGGPEVQWRPGRFDAPDESFCAPDNLPAAHSGNDAYPHTSTAEALRAVFIRMGFNDQETVALIGGGHAIGRCHPTRSGYNGPWTNTPFNFGNDFFTTLVNTEWYSRMSTTNLPQYSSSFNGSLDASPMMLPSDRTMQLNNYFSQYTTLYASNQTKFYEDFSAAFKKLVELGVKFDGVDPFSAAASAAPSFLLIFATAFAITCKWFS